MTVVFEGFSIREYASNMRSIDVVKCWPFSGVPSSSSSDDDDDDNNGINSNKMICKQSIESLLPPITVTKFRLWSQELDLLKNKHDQPSNKSEFLQVNNPDMLESLVRGAASTVNALNAHHVHSCLTQPSTQMRMVIEPTKSRTPKKRSITDIFATAPQIHENERPKKKKKKKKKVANVKKLMNKRSKLKNNKNNKQDDGLIVNKENGSKLKMQTPVNFDRKQNNTLCNRGTNAISILGEKPSLECMFAKKKSKLFQASKLILEGEKPCSPVRGILKNPGKSLSGKNAAMCKLRATTQASTCGVQHSVRHVSFSGKDDVLGSHNNYVAPFEKNILHVDLDSLELSEKSHQNDGDKEFPSIEINTSDDEDVSFSTENGVAVQAAKEKQLLPDIHYNVQGNQSAFRSPPYTGAPRLFSEVKKIQNTFVNSQVCGGVLTTLNCTSQFVDHFGDHTQEVPISSKANLRAPLHPSSSGFSLSKSANETDPFTLQFASGNVSGHALSHQKIYRPTPNELKGRLYPFLDCKQKEVSLREKCSGEEFFGLPLNSLGELVHTNSNGKGGFNQLRKPSQLSLFPDQSHMKENGTVHSSARVGAQELQGHRKDGYCINSDWRYNRSDCSMNTSFSECRPHDQFRNRNEKDISNATKNAEKMLLNSPTPTMRLMGTDVTICRSSNERQGFEDTPKSTALQNACVDKHFQQEWLVGPASGKCKERPVRRFDITKNHAFPSNVIMKLLESNFFHPEFQNSSSTTIGRDLNPSSRHPHTSHATFDNGTDFQEPFISRTETLRVSSRLPAVSASHRNYLNIKGNSVELKNNQNPPNAGKLSFNFPFLLPDHVEHFQMSPCRESSKSLIPWLLQETQQVQAPRTPSQPFPEVGGRCHSHTAQTNRFNCLGPRFPIASYDNNLMISYSHMESSVGQPSLAHSPLITSIPVIKPTSVNLSQRNEIVFKDRMKSKVVSAQDPDIYQQDYLMKHIKVPNLGIRDESRVATWLTRDNFINDIQRNMGSLELKPKRNGANIEGWIPNESQCNGLGLSTGIDSSKVDTNGVTKMGPIKLSPGVKHILKPHQNTDHDNSRLIHSTIPFASLTECGNMLETQEKSTKIYRL